MGSKPARCFWSFLHGVQETGFARRREWPIPLIANGAGRFIDSNNRNADRMPASSPELDHLILEVVDHAIDLFDHRLREYLHLHADFDCRYGSPPNEVTWVEDCDLARNDLAKSSVPTTSLNTPAPILNIQYAIFPLENGIRKFGRPLYGEQVFVEMHRDEIALIRRAMLVEMSLKQAAKLVQQPVFVLFGRLRQR